MLSHAVSSCPFARISAGRPACFQVLADALGDLQNPCLGLSTEYPWAMAIAGYTALLTFCAEYGINHLLWSRYGAASTPSQVCF